MQFDDLSDFESTMFVDYRYSVDLALIKKLSNIMKTKQKTHIGFPDGPSFRYGNFFTSKN